MRSWFILFAGFAVLFAACGGAMVTATPPPVPATATPTATLASAPSATRAPTAPTAAAVSASSPTQRLASPTATRAPDPVLVGAGDTAACDSAGAKETAKLLGQIPGTIFVAGDLAYPNGTGAEFANCYGATWGQYTARTRPAPGNHEYGTTGAAAYFAYFGAAAGNPNEGYYSYDLGAWHIVVLNSNCDQIGGCGPGSPQEQWLRADLAAHPAFCTLAYWHHPRFSSGPHGSNAALQPLWQALYDGGADVVLNGHDHDYERFAPQTPTGVLDRARGIREFVVGTGGRSHYTIKQPIANSEVHNDTAFGVLKLTLHPRGYDWQFIPVAGQRFADAGSASCH